MMIHRQQKKPRIDSKDEKERQKDETLLKRRQELKARVSALQADDGKECKDLTSRQEKDMHALLKKHEEEVAKMKSSQDEEMQEIKSKRALLLAEANSQVESIASELGIHECALCTADFYETDPRAVLVVDEDDGERCAKCASYGCCNFCKKTFPREDLHVCGPCGEKGCEGCLCFGCAHCGDFDGESTWLCQSCGDELNKETCGDRTCDECHWRHEKHCECPKRNW